MNIWKEKKIFYNCLNSNSQYYLEAAPNGAVFSCLKAIFEIDFLG